MSLDGVVVSKPWGYEYLCYRNSAVAIWFLHITCGQRTSLHCHPNKHTGFVVLQGSVRIRFLRGGSELTGLDKIHIFRARFHSTEALSKSGAYILEIETPEDKHDLVKIAEICKASYNDKMKEFIRQQGGQVMGLKAVHKREKRAALIAREEAKRNQVM